HPHITHAITAAITTPGAGHQLTTALMLNTGAGFDAAAVKRFLVDRLPAYMIPERFVVLDELPLTGNGKVDRAEVARRLAQEPVEAADDPPDGPIETELANLWAEILNVTSVGRRQSFFSLGGDSILATQLVEAIRRRFAVRLPMRQLYGAPTIVGLAAQLSEHIPAPLADLEDWTV
ncbi:MAG TPA: phosphopantetheine-binding protein, partial [Pseudonocardiaceae bacterium]|nr:phosphopantetheine-binding protein [Pseudonocardiaceae bacterium]